MYDLTSFIKFTKEIVEEAYDSDSAYDCANVVNILYTIGQLPNVQERISLAKRLKEYIDKTTGIVEVEGHINTHSTAFILGALNLLDEESWLTGFRKETSHPLLFHKNCEPKEAYYAVLKTVE